VPEWAKQKPETSVYLQTTSKELYGMLKGVVSPKDEKFVII